MGKVHAISQQLFVIQSMSLLQSRKVSEQLYEWRIFIGDFYLFLMWGSDSDEITLKIYLDFTQVQTTDWQTKLTHDLFISVTFLSRNYQSS